MALQDQRNRAVCGAFLAQFAAALAAKARAVANDAASKPLALAILRAPAAYAAKFAPTIAADAALDKVGPNVPRNAQGEDTGNGWSYPAPDDVLTAAVDAAWTLLVEIEG